ncbi:MAG: Omp28-related outer membrane protein [Bacteroidetes bacterium]|nr:Omp28-related outer membrane protein [Bacteroidota bacterium]
MKKLNFIIGVIASFLLASCEEIPPYINMEPDTVIEDTTYVGAAPTPQLRRIVIEEFTGVRCPNCPKAQAEAKNISNANPGRVSIITIHSLGLYNSLTTPFDSDKYSNDKHKSKFDFRTKAGAEIFKMVGLTQGLPSGNVCRTKFNGEVSTNIDYQKWSAYANAEIAKPTPVNIDLSAKNVGDEVEVRVTVTYTEAVTDSNFITVAILEGELEDVQESTDQNGVTIYVEDYIHNHVLRAVLSGFFGDQLKAAYTPGRVFIKTYRFKRGADWNPSNLEAIAMVHKDVISKTIIHAKEVKVQ